MSATCGVVRNLFNLLLVSHHFYCTPYLQPGDKDEYGQYSWEESYPQDFPTIGTVKKAATEEPLLPIPNPTAEYPPEDEPQYDIYSPVHRSQPYEQPYNAQPPYRPKPYPRRRAPQPQYPTQPQYVPQGQYPSQSLYPSQPYHPHPHPPHPQYPPQPQPEYQSTQPPAQNDTEVVHKPGPTIIMIEQGGGGGEGDYYYDSDYYYDYDSSDYYDSSYYDDDYYSSSSSEDKFEASDFFTRQDSSYFEDVVLPIINRGFDSSSSSDGDVSSSFFDSDSDEFQFRRRFQSSEDSSSDESSSSSSSSGSSGGGSMSFHFDGFGSSSDSDMSSSDFFSSSDDFFSSSDSFFDDSSDSVEGVIVLPPGKLEDYKVKVIIEGILLLVKNKAFEFEVDITKILVKEVVAIIFDEVKDITATVKLWRLYFVTEKHNKVIVDDPNHRKWNLRLIDILPAEKILAGFCVFYLDVIVSAAVPGVNDATRRFILGDLLHAPLQKDGQYKPPAALAGPFPYL